MAKIPVMDIYHHFSFHSARSLPHLPPEHPCARTHGHTFKIEIRLKGPVNQQDGWVIDYNAIAKVVEPLIESLDHRNLNDIDGMNNKPSNETIAYWFWQRLKPQLPLLTQITVIDTEKTGCIYCGEENEQG